jgi:hypothetical protein
MPLGNWPGNQRQLPSIESAFRVAFSLCNPAITQGSQTREIIAKI